MGVVEILFIGIGLSMDAFAVSVCKGLAVARQDNVGIKTEKNRYVPKLQILLIPALYFGGFQALMPLLGWLLGFRFQNLIESFDHWIAFFLLAMIGANMIREALSEGEEEKKDGKKFSVDFSVLTMLGLAVATSIDALAVGVSFAFLQIPIGFAVLWIGSTTFLISAAGVELGYLFGMRFQKQAQMAGGIILILIGIRILLEHLGVWGNIF